MKTVKSVLTFFVTANLLLVIGCNREELKPVDDFYRFEKLRWLILQKQKKTQYVLGYDTKSIDLTVAAYEVDGDKIPTPQEAVTYFSNSQELVDGQFVPDSAGKFKLYGKLAGRTSDTLTVSVWDPAELSLRLSVLNEAKDVLYADGADTVGFKVEVLAKGNVLPIQFNYAIKTDGLSFTKNFSTKTPGIHRFRAEAFGIKSNEIVVQAARTQAYNVIRLPVIFHEINTKDLDAKYIRQLTDGITKAFRNKFNATGGQKDVNAKDLYVEFYPATTSFNGTPLKVPGLDQIEAEQSTFTGEEAFQEAFNEFWSPDQYVNVWVMPITGAMENSSWAYVPYVTQPYDGFGVMNLGVQPFFPFGIFLNHNHIRQDYNGGRTEETLAHEMGHILGLYHIFDGNGTEHNGCSTGDPDFCFDTPFYDRAAYLHSLEGLSGSKFFGRQSCDDIKYTATNFMDYYYSYNNSFTTEQMKRVRHAISYGLWLPTPSNGYGTARRAGMSKVKRPANLKYVKPIVCW